MSATGTIAGARGAGRPASDPSVRRWVGRGALAIGDHGVTAGAGLVLNVLLARWAPVDAYGAFAVGFGLLLLATTAHTALILEPMSVLGTSRFGSRIPSYLGVVRVLSRRLMIPVTAALVAGGLVWELAGDGPLPGALLGAALALPAVVLHWLARRISYVRGDPGRALRVSAGYAVLVVAGLPVLAARPTPLAAFLVLTVAATIPAWVALRDVHTRGGSSSIAIREVVTAHWSYGRWMVASAVVTVAFTYGQTLIAAGFIGLDAAGALRAMQIVTLPMTHVITAIATLVLPRISADHGRRGVALIRAKGRRVSYTLVALAIAYEVGLIFTYGPVEHMLFGGRFSEQAWLLPVLGLAPVFAAITTGSSLMLRAIQRPEHYLVAAAVTASVGLASSIGFTVVFGVAGAAASIVITAGATMIAAEMLVRRWVPTGGVKR